jgi:hypothetical protein
MPVLGERVGQLFIAHRLHRNTIAQAVAFVNARLVQGHACQKIFMGVRDDLDSLRPGRDADIAGSLAPERLAPLGKMQVLDHDQFGRDNFGRSQGRDKFHGLFMQGVQLERVEQATCKNSAPIYAAAKPP